MKIQKRSVAEIHVRPYGELLLLAGNTHGTMRTITADLKVLRIRPHESTSHHFHLSRESIYHVLEGHLTAHSAFSSTNEQITTGDTIIVPPGEDHTFTCVGPSTASVLEIESPPHDSADKFPATFRLAGAPRPLGRFWSPDSVPHLKICGVRTLDVAYACSELGVDAIGFHAVGPLWHGVMDAADWVDALPNSLSIALLTDLEEPALVAALLSRLRCDTIQIQGNKKPESIIALAKLVHQMGVQVIKSVAVPSADQLSSTIEDVRTIEPHVDAILVDSHWRGGTGEPCDITIIHKICNHLNGRIVVAGGIGETNILKYMSSLRPYAFDVESSVEWQFVVNGRRVTAKSVQKITSLLSLLRSQTTLTF